MRTIWNLPVITFTHFSEFRDDRPALLVTSKPAWTAVGSQLHGLKPLLTCEAIEASIPYWAGLLPANNEEIEVVFAVGGGLAVDAAKYLSYRLALPLICLPTALSVDAFLTAASGIRRDGCVYYIETKPPDYMVVDLDVIAAAPEWIRSAGITDVLSIATGCWDWEFAQQHKKNPPGMELIPWVYDNAQSILRGALDCAEAAGRGDAAGLKALLDCLCLEVQLCNQVGHARPEEGSEHYFAYQAENLLGHGLPHGDLVGPGIMIMAELQGQPLEPLKAALQACHIPLDRIPSEVVRQVNQSLPDYARRHGLAYGIAHELDRYL
jgi:glycerol-1-phosphate dehydrogenase [NAD(P)+]